MMGNGKSSYLRKKKKKAVKKWEVCTKEKKGKPIIHDKKKLRGIREFEEYLEKKSVYCTREVVFK